MLLSAGRRKPLAHVDQHDHDAPMSIPGLTLTLYGDPVPLPRGRHLKGRRKPVSIASPKAKRYATALESAARASINNLGGDPVVRQAFASHALAVSIWCQFSTRNTTRWGQPHTHKPDGDNICKMALDCLARAGALGGDDCRVSDTTIRKFWGERGMLSVSVRPIRPDNTTPSSTRPPHLADAPGWLKGEG